MRGVALAFAGDFALLGRLSLPGIWAVMRVTPPRPQIARHGTVPWRGRWKNSTTSTKEMPPPCVPIRNAREMARGS